MQSPRKMVSKTEILFSLRWAFRRRKSSVCHAGRCLRKGLAMKKSNAPKEQWRSRIRVNGAELYYEEQGTGSETIFFSHGLLWSCRMFDDQIAINGSREIAPLPTNLDGCLINVPGVSCLPTTLL